MANVIAANGKMIDVVETKDITADCFIPVEVTKDLKPLEVKGTGKFEVVKVDAGFVVVDPEGVLITKVVTEDVAGELATKKNDSSNA